MRDEPDRRSDLHFQPGGGPRDDRTFSAVTLSYGLRDGRLVHVRDVPNGKRCGCICPHCKGALIARNHGEKRSAHFAHDADHDCAGARESALHLLAKRILGERKRLCVPSGAGLWPGAAQGLDAIGSPGVLAFDEVTLEPSVEQRRPDAEARRGEFRVFVEFHVTHAVDEGKADFLRRQRVPTIEVDLCPILQTGATEAEIRTIIEERADDRRWIVHPPYDAVREALHATGKVRMLGEATACPIVPELLGRPCIHDEVPFLTIDCRLCPCFGGTHGDRYLCMGRQRITRWDDLLRIDAGEELPIPSFFADAYVKELRQRAESHRGSATAANKARQSMPGQRKWTPPPPYRDPLRRRGSKETLDWAMKHWNRNNQER